MTARDSAIKNLKELKGKPFKVQAEYILTYYWFPILSVVLAIIAISSTVKTMFFSPRYVLSGYSINSYIRSETTAEDMTRDFLEASGIDTRKYTVMMYDHVFIDPDSNVVTNEFQSLAARLSAKAVDFICTDYRMFESLVVGDVFLDMRELLSAEQLQRYSDYFVYADKAALMAWMESDTNEPPQVAVGAPEGMTDAMPVGVRLQPGSRFLQVYDFHEPEPVIGIVKNAGDAEMALRFLDYCMK